MRLVFIDGLRGLFAMLVVISHYSAFFFDVIFPHGFRNSSGSVCGFFIITGFILSYKFWINGEIAPLTSSALRRYIRLTALPFVSILIAYVLYENHWLFNNEITQLARSSEFIKFYYQFDSHFRDALREGLYGMYLSFDQITSFNPVLWTMQYELKGSMLLLAFLALFGKIKNRTLMYIILMVITAKTLYLPFVIGVMFADMMYTEEGKRYRKILIEKKYLSWLSLVVGIFLYGYARDSSFSLYGGMNFPFFARHSWAPEPFYHTLGAAMVIYAVIQLEVLQKILSQKIFTVPGKYSFSIYVIHILAMGSAGGLAFLFAFNHGFSLPVCVAAGNFGGILAMSLALKPLHNLVNLPAENLAKRVEKLFK